MSTFTLTAATTASESSATITTTSITTFPAKIAATIPPPTQNITATMEPNQKCNQTFTMLYPELLLLISDYLPLSSLHSLVQVCHHLNNVLTPTLYQRAADCTAFFYPSSIFPYPSSPPSLQRPRNWPARRHLPRFPCGRIPTSAVSSTASSDISSASGGTNEGSCLHLQTGVSGGNGGKQHHCCSYPYHVFKHISAAGNFDALKAFLERYKRLERHPLKRYALDAAVVNVGAARCLDDEGGFVKCRGEEGGRQFTLVEGKNGGKGRRNVAERARLVGYLVAQGADWGRALEAIGGLKRAVGEKDDAGVNLVEVALREVRKGRES